MMKTRLLKWCLGLLAGFICLNVMASEPIKDRDAFEKQYIECMKKGFGNDCFFSLFVNRMVPPDTPDVPERIKKINDHLKGRLANSRVYDVYVVDKMMTAGIAESRNYLIELEGDGGLIGCRVFFRRILGKWYVYSFVWLEDEESIQKMLNFQKESSTKKF
jgi:hypothetical protein